MYVFIALRRSNDRINLIQNARFTLKLTHALVVASLSIFISSSQLSALHLMIPAEALNVRSLMVTTLDRAVAHTDKSDHSPYPCDAGFSIFNGFPSASTASDFISQGSVVEIYITTTAVLSRYLVDVCIYPFSYLYAAVHVQHSPSCRQTCNTP